ncbi:hypothetical protein [Oceanobacillus halotolerans]|uniref:hypothetical protein n=1 Tax=Oceanobacillus halotolerans TaxID=2663380 RepID=UPI0013DAA04F|nr:hypothetical protein [Oceanobacillus halotolerans]
MNNIISFNIQYSKDIHYLLDIYQKCALLEIAVDKEFEEFLNVDLGHQTYEDLGKSYENLLFAAICEIGGHKGHFNYLHATDCVYQFINKNKSWSSLATEINDIIRNNFVEGTTKEKIAVSEAVELTGNGIEEYQEHMSNALTLISGQPVTFRRFNDILKQLEFHFNA